MNPDEPEEQPDPVDPPDDPDAWDAEQTSDDLAARMREYLTANPRSRDALLTMPHETIVSRLSSPDRPRHSKGHHRRRRKQPAGDWSQPPPVPKDDAKEFRAMAGTGPYQGMDEGTARARFATYDLDWDTVTPGELTKKINEMRRNRTLADELGPACFVFCDLKIPGEHRLDWVVAIMAARDRHEEEFVDEDSD